MQIVQTHYLRCIESFISYDEPVKTIANQIIDRFTS